MLRRTFLLATATGCATTRELVPRAPDPAPHSPAPTAVPPHDTFDPWIEVSLPNLAHNVETVSGLAGGRPVLAVIKNNAYGTGLLEAASHLETLERVTGLAVGNFAEGIRLRDAGIRKPVLILGPVAPAQIDEAVARDLSMGVYRDYADELVAAARRHDRKARVHFYVDTGLGRVGVPHRDAPQLLRSLAAHPEIAIDGLMTGLTEDVEFDVEQAKRLQVIADQAQKEGIDVGSMHAASSAGAFDSPAAHFDVLRPGIALQGGYPSARTAEEKRVELRPVASLRARIAYLKRMEPGDSVQYHRAWVAQERTWVATVAMGHTDGWPPGAAGKTKAHVGSRAFPIIGAVTGNHTLFEIGPEKLVEIGDTVTFLGEHDSGAVHPNTVATAAGEGTYKLLWRLGRHLPRVVRG